MILLEKSRYNLLLEPLNELTFNTIFAHAVVENKVSGLIYVDEAERPKTFYVLHPYGMSLLFGESDNMAFNEGFREYALNIRRLRNRHEWMQASSDQWNQLLQELFSGKLIKSGDNTQNLERGVIELNTRVNFKFNPQAYLKRNPVEPDPEIRIVRTDARIFEEMKGTVVPSYFWDSADDFVRHGIGFSLYCKGQLAATAYAAYIQGQKLELGIETVVDFRGKGFAQQVCSALIDFCLQNNYEPVWACKLENTASYNLAQKMGFEQALLLPYYRLSN